MDYFKKGIKGKPKDIELIPYDPSWPALFEQERQKIQMALGENYIAIHHFGSTAVPGLQSKPVIDIICVVKDLSSIDIPSLEQLGFEYRGEVILSGRYLSKRNPRVHLHLFEQGNPLIQQNLDFRDWLRSHKDDREAYAALKLQLAKQHKDGVSYARAKTEFCEAIFQKMRS